MRAPALGIVVLAALLLAAPAITRGAEWGLIQPGVSATQSVRERYGAPTRVVRQKVDNYDTESWVYEGDRAPTGIVRLTVDFGLLRDGKYRPEIVRAFQLEPHGSTFNRGIVVNGWGLPDGGGRQGDEEYFVYKEGLLVYFDKDNTFNVRLMIFTLPQPRDPTEERR
jgi:hypothetical protein